MTQPRTETDVEALNDRLAREHPIDDYYDRSPLVVRFVERRRLAIIREMVAARTGETVMEVGSGGGHVLRMFPQAHLVAVDVSDVFLDTARKNLAGYDVEFHKGQLTELGLPKASFDAVICTEVLEHTTNPDEIIAEIASLLKPTGRAVITVPVDPMINGLKRIVRRTPIGWALGNGVNWGGDQYHLHQWWPWQFERVLRRHLRVVERKSAPFDWLPLRACFLCRP